MKKFLCLFLAFACMLGMTACKDKEPTFTTEHTKNGYDPASVMDGDVNVGWIGGKKASETSFQVFNIDFGEEKTFSTITIDDSFLAGYTNKKPEYLPETVVYNTGDVSSLDSTKGEMVNVLSGAADGLSWVADAIPTADAPVWLWVSLQETVNVKKIELNNEMNNSVSVSYELYYSSEAHNRREGTYTDVSTYTLLAKDTANTENIVEIENEEAVAVRDLLLKIYCQQNEGVDVVASLDEIFMFSETPADYHEEHQPEKFSILGSNDGKTYLDIVEVNGNYNSVWTHTLSAPVTYRYIKYIVFAEYNNNYPSLGEISFS